MTLQNYQYDEIMRQYARRQAKGRQILSERQRCLFARFPRLEAIDGEIAAISAESLTRILKLDARGREQGLNDLKRRIAALSQERTAILRGAGYPADYLSVPCDCPLCQDTGYVGSEKCVCFRSAEVALLYAQSNLSDDPQESFDAFSFSYYDTERRDESSGKTEAEHAKKAFDTCVSFVKNFDSKGGNLFLYGDTGVGKTFLSRCVARALLDTAHLVLYFSAEDLFAQLADSAFSKEASSLNRQDLLEADFLIIDDLGTEMTNSFVSSQLFQIVNERLIRNRSTMISTNLNLSEFSGTYSERTVSRITGSYQMLKLIGSDIRLQKKFGSIRSLYPGNSVSETDRL